LPGIDALYQGRKADGLKVFAVNQQETEDTIKPFVAQLHLSMPVLLDTDGKVNAAYGADAIPETVVVGRNGVVRNVFIGAGNDQDIASAVDEALRDR